jgi:hypothetical protein
MRNEVVEELIPDPIDKSCAELNIERERGSRKREMEREKASR